jgi:hypothetical protein
MAICFSRGSLGEALGCLFVPFYVYYWLFWLVDEKDSHAIDTLRLLYVPSTLMAVGGQIRFVLGGGLK